MPVSLKTLSLTLGSSDLCGWTQLSRKEADKQGHVHGTQHQLPRGGKWGEGMRAGLVGGEERKGSPADETAGLPLPQAWEALGLDFLCKQLVDFWTSQGMTFGEIVCGMILVAGKETGFCSRGRGYVQHSAVTQQPLGSGQEFDSVLVSQLKNAGAWVSPLGILIPSVLNERASSRRLLETVLWVSSMVQSQNR